MIHVALLGREAILFYTWRFSKQGKKKVETGNVLGNWENKKDAG